MAQELQQDSNRMDKWNESWDQGHIGFHNPQVHDMLEKHIDRLLPRSDIKKVFVPLCGKSVDMKWLADKGVGVVGVDGAAEALKQYFSDQSQEYECETVAGLPGEGQLYKSKDNLVRLYCCDLMDFNEKLEGKFDAIWDRGSLVALDRNDIPQYVSIIKSLLNSGGSCLVETMEYDPAEANALTPGSNAHPPPFPMLEAEVKGLYEPECTVEFLDSREFKMKNVPVGTTLIFLITKK